MACPHPAADIIISKDQQNVYEICSNCNQLIMMTAFDKDYDKKPYYIMPSYDFKDMFEIKNNGLHFKTWTRQLYPLRESGIPSKYFYKNNFSTLPIQKKEPKFFTNMNTEGLL